MRIKDFSIDNRPREKFLLNGPDNLTDSELLALILRTGNLKENVVEMSNRLILKHGLDKLFDCSVEELMKIDGIGESKATQILAISEISKRREMSKKKKVKIISAKCVFDLFYDKLKDKTKEYFFIILLDSKNNILKCEEVSVGILDASIVHPREIFKPAIRTSASRIILVHNHPSGEPNPSEEDLLITKRLIDCGELLGIEVLDHVIIGDKIYWSYSEN